MALESLSGSLDPLLWARKPRSPIALEFVRRGAAENTKLSEILQQHIENGVCTEMGTMLMKWDMGQWVSVQTT